METRQQKGRRSEDLAAEFFKDQGMKIIAQNVRFPIGEIDLIVKDGKTTVFVEVRSRSAGGYGSPQESVTHTKQRKLTKLAQWYLKQNGLGGQPARFDVVAITWQDSKPELTWIVNAFEACE
jgi:putative endonuclease